MRHVCWYMPRRRLRGQGEEVRPCQTRRMSRVQSMWSPMLRKCNPSGRVESQTSLHAFRTLNSTDTSYSLALFHSLYRRIMLRYAVHLRKHGLYRSECLHFWILTIHPRADSAYFHPGFWRMWCSTHVVRRVTSMVVGSQIAGCTSEEACESRPRLFLFTFFCNVEL